MSEIKRKEIKNFINYNKGKFLPLYKVVYDGNYSKLERYFVKIEEKEGLETLILLILHNGRNNIFEKYFKDNNPIFNSISGLGISYSTSIEIELKAIDEDVVDLFIKNNPGYGISFIKNFEKGKVFFKYNETLKELIEKNKDMFSSYIHIGLWDKPLFDFLFSKIN